MAGFGGWVLYNSDYIGDFSETLSNRTLYHISKYFSFTGITVILRRRVRIVPIYSTANLGSFDRLMVATSTVGSRRGDRGEPTSTVRY